MSSPANRFSTGTPAAHLSPAPAKGHQHSLSSGSANSKPAQPAATSFAAAASPSNNSQQKFRASMGTFAGKASSGARPTSELLSGSGIGASASPETEAIDRWFEDLQHYEATLEEMAAASLDQNFKEELNAIEQWFRVLSEAERTAALYSLLQSSTQVQIRFFIQVLQQMARADPMTALLSPSGQSASMENQMEAKLAAMGFKSPASPVVKQFARQSMGPADVANFLSPNDANAAALLASQRAKLKAQSNRISAPGTLSHAADALKSPLWTQASNEAVAENRRSPSPSARPKSTGSDVGAQLAAMNTSNGLAQFSADPNHLLRSPNVGAGAFDSELSPMVGGNWSSMVNTPLVPMFTDREAENVDLNGANNRLQGWGNQSGNQGPNGIVLDDAKKFRRSGRAEGPGFGNMPMNNQNMGAMGNFGGGNNRRMPPTSSPQMRQSMLATSGGSNSQQAALSAQANWRNVNGIMTPNLNSAMSPQDMANALMQQQQMMQAQLQLQQNLIMGGMMGGLMSPNLGMMGMGMNSPILSGTAKRSPRPGGNFSGFGSAGPGNRTPNSANNAVGSGANPDEVVDQKLLDDVPSWLRSLRLHKYTPNFERTKWEDMVQMDDAALEAHGVGALGARRKLLKVFENVRIQKGMQEAGTEEQGGNESVFSGGDTTAEGERSRSNSPALER